MTSPAVLDGTMNAVNARQNAPNNPQSVLTPITSPNMLLFLTTLPASKAAGVAAIRLSLVRGGEQLEELDAQGNRIIGLVLQFIVDARTQKVTVPVTQMGSSGSPAPFTAVQLSAFGLITNELKQFAANPNAAKSSIPKARGVKLSFRQIVAAVGAGIACGAAAVELGANPLADVGCAADASLVIADSTDSDNAPDVTMQDLFNNLQQAANTPIGGGNGDVGNGDGDGGDGGGGGLGPADGPDGPAHKDE